MLIPLLMNLNMLQSGVTPPEPEPEAPSTPGGGGHAGKWVNKRWSGKRPPYWWEARTKTLREIPLPTDEASAKVAVEVMRDLEELWDDLKARDRRFDEMLAEVNHLIKQATFYLESRRLEQLLAETKQRIEAAKDAQIAAQRAEEAEINEIMELL